MAYEAPPSGDLPRLMPAMREFPGLKRDDDARSPAARMTGGKTDLMDVVKMISPGAKQPTLSSRLTAAKKVLKDAHQLVAQHVSPHIDVHDVSSDRDIAVKCATLEGSEAQALEKAVGLMRLMPLSGVAWVRWEGDRTGARMIVSNTFLLNYVTEFCHTPDAYRLKGDLAHQYALADAAPADHVQRLAARHFALAGTEQQAVALGGTGVAPDAPAAVAATAAAAVAGAAAPVPAAAPVSAAPAAPVVPGAPGTVAPASPAAANAGSDVTVLLEGVRFDLAAMSASERLQLTQQVLASRRAADEARHLEAEHERRMAVEAWKMETARREEARKEADHKFRMTSLRDERLQREEAHRLRMDSRRVEAELVCSNRALAAKSQMIEATRHEMDRLSGLTDAASQAQLRTKEELMAMLHRVSAQVKFAVPAGRGDKREMAEATRLSQTTLDKDNIAECLLPTRYNVVTGTAVDCYPLSHVVKLLYGATLSEKQMNRLGSLVANAKRKQTGAVEPLVYQIPTGQGCDERVQRAYTLHELTTPPISDVIKQFLADMPGDEAGEPGAGVGRVGKKRKNVAGGPVVGQQRGMRRFFEPVHQPGDSGV